MPETLQIKLDYKPHKFQQQFHKSNKMIRLMSSGIRGGKSIGLLMEAIKLSHAGWKSFGVPNEGCIVSPTYMMLRDILLPIFDSVMAKAEAQSGFKLVAKFNKNDMICQFANGSRILFRSAEFPDRLRGPKFQWFALDEPREMKKEIYPVMHGRIADSDGCGFLATTTKGHDWVYDNIIKPYNEKTDPDIDVIRWSSYDNPYFPKHRIDKLKQLYSEEFFKQEIMADIIAIKGVVYKDFSRFTHVKDFTFDNMKYFIAGVDFGYNQPAILLIGFDSDGAAYVCDEWYESEKLTSDIIGVLKSWQQQYKLDVVLCDPADPGAIKELQDSGLPAVAAENAVAVGINKVSEYLRPGRLTIHTQCLNLIKEIEVYHYREGTDAPVKVYDHACFPAGTMITLKDGDKPIEEVRVGDMALTRKGYRKVLVSGMTSKSSELLKLTLDDSSCIKATPNHPIWVHGKGFKAMDTMRYGDVLCVLRKSNLKGSRTVDILTRKTVAIGLTLDLAAQILTEDLGIYIKRFGKRIMALYLKTITYTTRMVIPQTTQLLISIVFPNMITSQCMEKTHSEITAPRNLNISQKLDHLLRNGMLLKRVSAGTQNMVKMVGRKGNQLKRYVLTAPNRLIQLLEEIATNIAQTNASLHGEGNPESTTKQEYVRYARKNLQPVNIAKPRHALNAAEVVSLEKQKEKCAVYNLEVEDMHEYFANGILVSNCDALRYSLVGAKKEQEFKQPDYVVSW